jgi:hypothetical protein
MKSAHLIGIAAGLLLGIAIAADALAHGGNFETRTVPAMSGHAWNPADASCFGSGWAQVSNNCSTTKKYLIPLTLDVPASGGPSKSYHFWLTVVGASGKTITCRTVVNDTSNGGWSSPTRSWTLASQTSFDMGAVTVNPVNLAHIDCDMGAGTSAIAAFFGFPP